MQKCVRKSAEVCVTVCVSLGFLLVCNGIQERGLYCTVRGDSGCVFCFQLQNLCVCEKGRDQLCLLENEQTGSPT